MQNLPNHSLLVNPRKHNSLYVLRNYLYQNYIRGNKTLAIRIKELADQLGYTASQVNYNLQTLINKQLITVQDNHPFRIINIVSVLTNKSNTKSDIYEKKKVIHRAIKHKIFANPGKYSPKGIACRPSEGYKNRRGWSDRVRVLRYSLLSMMPKPKPPEKTYHSDKQLQLATLSNFIPLFIKQLPCTFHAKLLPYLHKYFQNIRDLIGRSKIRDIDALLRTSPFKMVSNLLKKDLKWQLYNSRFKGRRKAMSDHTPQYIAPPDWTDGNVPSPRTMSIQHEVKAVKRHNRHIITHMLQCIGLKQEEITDTIFENAAYLFAGRQPITRENLMLNG